MVEEVVGEVWVDTSWGGVLKRVVYNWLLLSMGSHVFSRSSK